MQCKAAPLEPARDSRVSLDGRGSIMLKFLTHKLRTHSLNEENVSEKVGVAAALPVRLKVTPPPENGRPAENKEAQRAMAPGPLRSRTERLKSLLTFFIASRTMPARMRAPRRAGRPPRRAGGIDRGAEVLLFLQVEERDSGTESDDEADRADTGKYAGRPPTLLTNSCDPSSN